MPFFLAGKPLATLTESYIFQAALFRQGDIAFRYDTLNFGALTTVPSVSGDNPINVPPHHTAGISATDGNRWLGITDDTTSQEVVSLRDGSGRNVIHYFQSCHGWTISAILTRQMSAPWLAQPCVAVMNREFSTAAVRRRPGPTLNTRVRHRSVDLCLQSSRTTTFPAWNAGHLKSGKSRGRNRGNQPHTAN